MFQYNSAVTSQVIYDPLRQLCNDDRIEWLPTHPTLRGWCVARGIMMMQVLPSIYQSSFDRTDPTSQGGSTDLRSRELTYPSFSLEGRLAMFSVLPSFGIITSSPFQGLLSSIPARILPPLGWCKTPTVDHVISLKLVESV